jgi:hypothetical protein
MNVPIANDDKHCNEPQQPLSAPVVRCGIYRLTATGLERPSLVRPDDLLVLLIELGPTNEWHHNSCSLCIEFWRGDELRDRIECQIELKNGEAWSRAIRLCWRDRAASSRLCCRVLLNGNCVTSCRALLGSMRIDGQGRFVEGWADGGSSATMVAYEQELERRLQRADGA